MGHQGTLPIRGSKLVWRGQVQAMPADHPVPKITKQEHNDIGAGESVELHQTAIATHAREDAIEVIQKASSHGRKLNKAISSLRGA